MPLPRPKDGETQDAWLDRCMGDETMRAEFGDDAQRAAVCANLWRGQRGKSDAGGSSSAPPTGGITGPGGGSEGGLKRSAGAAAISLLSAGGTPRTAFPLLKFGVVEVDRPAAGPDQPFLFTRAQAEMILANFRKLGRRLVIDYEHQSIARFNTRPDGRVPAAGWIGDLEIRGDGLWATRVDWTPEAAALLARGEYLYFSPVLYWTDQSCTAIRELGPVALTNDPSMRGVEPLVAGRVVLRVSGSHQSSVISRQSESPADSRGHKQDGRHGDRPLRDTPPGTDAGRSTVLAAGAPRPAKGGPGMDQIKQLLGLPAEATDEQVVAAIKQLLQGKEEATAATRKSVLVALCSALDIDPAEDVEALVTAAKAKYAEPPDAAAGVVTALKTQVAELQTQVSGLRESNARVEFDALLARREHAGKVPPADLDKYFGIFRSDRALFDTILGNMTPKVAAQSVLRGTAGAVTAAQTDRGALIVTACKTFAAECDEKTVLCSQRAWVNTALRDAGLKPLTAEELAKHAIAEE